jgi:hypothetical protein
MFFFSAIFFQKENKEHDGIFENISFVKMAKVLQVYGIGGLSFLRW